MFVLKTWEWFEVLKKPKYWSLKETGTSYKQKFVWADNPGQIYETK